ncbi:MAG TPA: peptidoglycan bridge formation glycyltransferase FemA/FemB family protein [Candidatus Sulfomarinibacteraceae bacterium]|nr:peptidoglycan bridge formation glycyltransferase FemA/FemB family protein [Candidatus Sulfomarinibacteraceae bacterium]
MSDERALAESAAWDAFVQAADPGSYLQLAAWARVKRANGWTATRLEVGDRGGPGPADAIGAQILLRRPRGLPWAFAYAPRGPVTLAWRPGLVAPFTDEVRSRLPAAGGRVSHLRIDPEVEIDGPGDPGGELRGALRAAGWRPGAPIQPDSTRLIDLRADEAALWGDLRKKWRQYVNRSRAAGVTVEEAGGDAVGTFYGIYRETAARAGFLIRTEAAYRDVWEAFRPLGLARLLIARLPDGEPAAALFLVRCGTRVVEPYGGMTRAGADSRANYLLKWEAIRTSREAGATVYDLWGLAHPGIAHFKTGFGGREVRYVGAWDLVVDGVGRLAYTVAQRGRVWLARQRAGIGGRTPGRAWPGEHEREADAAGLTAPGDDD